MIIHYHSTYSLWNGKAFFQMRRNFLYRFRRRFSAIYAYAYSILQIDIIFVLLFHLSRHREFILISFGFLLKIVSILICKIFIISRTVITSISPQQIIHAFYLIFVNRWLRMASMWVDSPLFKIAAPLKHLDPRKTIIYEQFP